MPQPTIERRLERRFIVMTSDPAFERTVRVCVPEDWSVVAVADLDVLGDWNDILLYRFLVLDADDSNVDAVETVRRLRTEFMLQIAVFCFGGAPALRDELRLARADRFYDHHAVGDVLPTLFGQYAW